MASHHNVNLHLKGSTKLEKFLTPLLVVAVGLIGPDGTILMQKRNFASVHGGLWEFPGGKVEPGETPESAAVRELQEELRITLDPERLVPVGFASGWTGAPAAEAGDGRRSLVILLYACDAWEGAPSDHEAEELAWYYPDAIADLAMPPLDYPLAAALCRHLLA